MIIRAEDLQKDDLIQLVTGDRGTIVDKPHGGIFRHVLVKKFPFSFSESVRVDNIDCVRMKEWETVTISKRQQMDITIMEEAKRRVHDAQKEI